MNRNFFVLFLCFVLSLLSGCAHYKPGFPLGVTFVRKIYVEPVSRRTAVPQALAVLTRQLRCEFLENGLKLAGPNDADGILETEIIDYGRSTSNVDDLDTDVARTLSLKITAKCSFKQANGLYFFKDEKISTSVKMTVSDSIQVIEYHRITELTQALAKKIAMFVFHVSKENDAKANAVESDELSFHEEISLREPILAEIKQEA